MRKTEPLFRAFLAWNAPEYAELGWLWPKHRGGMNEQVSPVATLVWTFGLMSPFAVGGANSAIPEMHRIAVDVHYGITDKQFAGVFAISQLSPGSNVLIVILIGYSVAGIFGALAATPAMCGPIAVVACFVSRLPERSNGAPWPAIIQAARPNPFWMLAAGGILGFAGVIGRKSLGRWLGAGVTIPADTRKGAATVGRGGDTHGRYVGPLAG